MLHCSYIEPPHRDCVTRLFAQNDLVLDVEKIDATAKEIGDKGEA